MPSGELKLLDLQNVEKRFEIKVSRFRKGSVHALNNVSVAMEKGKTLALVGESGCGKTTLGKVVLGLHQPNRGRILFEGHDIAHLDPRRRRRIQQNIQMIFQDPYASLNPRKKVQVILERPLKTYTNWDRHKRREAVARTCVQVGLDESYLERYPHQFSGGQRQRIAIARAIILNPSLVIADEPISALDVSIQAQILNLLMDLQDELALTYLFITHDISVVQHLSDYVAVMYLGQIVEYAPKLSLFRNPKHPYTQLLFSAVPDMNKPELSDVSMIRGEIPSPTSLPSGCFFAARCPHRMDRCMTERPEMIDVSEEHRVRCYLEYPQ